MSWEMVLDAPFRRSVFVLGMREGRDYPDVQSASRRISRMETCLRLARHDEFFKQRWRTSRDRGTRSRHCTGSFLHPLVHFCKRRMDAVEMEDGVRRMMM